MTYCIDCNILIDKRYTRCKSCAKRGILHPNYKKGRPKCINCNKQLVDYRSQRCSSCAIKKNMKNLITRLKIAKSRIGKRNSYKTEFKKRNNHWNWKGGKSYEKYPINFNSKLKEKIRKRDNYICQNCRITEEEHIIILGYNLVIHHIDYNKKNNNSKNLISLCNQCNLRANKNRKSWKKYFRRKINDIYQLCN